MDRSLDQMQTELAMLYREHETVLQYGGSLDDASVVWDRIVRAQERIRKYQNNLEEEEL